MQTILQLYLTIFIYGITELNDQSDNTTEKQSIQQYSAEIQILHTLKSENNSTIHTERIVTVTQSKESSASKFKILGNEQNNVNIQRSPNKTKKARRVSQRILINNKA